MWELDYKESRALKNWCFCTVVLEKTFESPLDCKEINPVNPKGNQSWMFIGRTDVEDEPQILWPPDVKNWLIGKDPNVGKDGRQDEKGMTEDEMVGWHHQLSRHEQALGVGDGQGSLACCSPWGHKELDMTEWLNRTRWCCRSSWDRLTSASSASVAKAQTSITVMLNGLPWKRTKITLSFLRLHSNTTFWTLLLTMRATPFLLRDSCPQ